MNAVCPNVFTTQVKPSSHESNLNWIKFNFFDVSHSVAGRLLCYWQYKHHQLDMLRVTCDSVTLPYFDVYWLLIISHPDAYTSTIPVHECHSGTKSKTLKPRPSIRDCWSRVYPSVDMVTTTKGSPGDLVRPAGRDIRPDVRLLLWRAHRPGVIYILLDPPSLSCRSG